MLPSCSLNCSISKKYYSDSREMLIFFDVPYSHSNVGWEPEAATTSDSYRYGVLQTILRSQLTKERRSAAVSAYLHLFSVESWRIRHHIKFQDYTNGSSFRYGLLFRVLELRHQYTVVTCFLHQFAVKTNFSYAYTQEFPYRPNQILECEFYLLENLDCCLIVYQPYRPLLQLIQDIGHEDQLLSLTWRLINDSLRTDLCLLYPPYQIAIGERSYHRAVWCVHSRFVAFFS
jgi:hypothetical protein